MYARVVTCRAQPARLGEMVNFFQACIVPAGEQQAGFEGILLLTDETAGKATSISFWRTMREMEAFAGDCLAQLGAEFAPFLQAAPVVEVFRVHLQADARPEQPILYFAETSLGIRVPNPGNEKSGSEAAGTFAG